MLESGADAGEEDEQEQRQEAVGKAEPDESDTRRQRSQRQEQTLTPSLRQQTRRNLQQRRGRTVRGADHRNLGIRQAERFAQQRQQRVEHIDQPVVQHMHATNRGECELGL